jgi:hypothetical protein
MNDELVPTINIEWEGQFHRREDSAISLIDLFLKDETQHHQIAATVGASMPHFANQAQADAWFEQTIKTFCKGYRQAVIDALGSLLAAASGIALIELGLSPLDKQAILGDHIIYAEKLIRRQLGLRPGRAPWRASELYISILRAMQSMPTNEKITYDNVASSLRKSHPDRAPHSGEALRKMLKEMKVEWKHLKGMANQERQKRKNGNSKNGKTENFAN